MENDVIKASDERINSENKTNQRIEDEKKKEYHLFEQYVFTLKKITFNNLKLEAYNTFSNRMNDLKRENKKWENDIMYNVFTSIDYYGSLFFFFFSFSFLFFNCGDFCLRSHFTLRLCSRYILLRSNLLFFRSIKTL